MMVILITAINFTKIVNYEKFKQRNSFSEITHLPKDSHLYKAVAFDLATSHQL
jgi:hypothetical protein